ncbi:MAG: GntR family transcriptional regulator [Bacilli bacterium]|nr:GntR family transcriptional regulator [Bacilli bacterium]MDD7548992.1 GntR family transcriptional regulator [Bacilli bacterium]MDD7598946.1 GntR family transcriptional regulator [Bacilli bacterium]MDY4156424.1 GntR family transcriptional regulator [Bacilli bacterium]MDY4724388.1 GntR family transcriptional regulator [Bacilli bacterium]
MAEEQIARYIKIAQDICGRILVGEYQEGMMLKGRSVLASFYNVSPETIRKAVNLLAKEKIVEIKRGVGIFVDSALHAQQFADKWKDKTLVQNKYANLLNLLEEKRQLDEEIDVAIKDMRDSFTYQTKEAVQLQEIMIPLDSWLDSKKIGDVYFYNYTEATIVAVVTKEEGRADTSPGPDYVLHGGDKLIFVSKDTMTFDRVASFLVYGVEE